MDDAYFMALLPYIKALTLPIAIGIGLAVYGALRLVQRLLITRLRDAGTTAAWADDLALALTRRTSEWFHIALAVGAAAAWLTGGKALPMPLRLVLLLIIGWQCFAWGTTLLEFWLHDRAGKRGGVTASDSATVGVISLIARGALALLILIVALDNLGVNVTALVTGLGITGIAVALAVQNILGDLLAALAIALDKPFTVGEEVEVGELRGRISDIGLKTTRIRAHTGEEVCVANSEILKGKLVNQSRTVQRRVVVRTEYDAGAGNAEALDALLSRVRAAVSGVTQTHDAQVQLKALREGRAEVTVDVATTATHEQSAVRAALLIALSDQASRGGPALLSAN
jgi:small-conductance mechanosensitive channel